MAQDRGRTAKKEKSEIQRKREVRREVQQKIERYLKNIEISINNYQYVNPKLKCLFINGYNHFYSGYILGKKGMRCQSFNCLRFGLESIWLGLYLENHPDVVQKWILGPFDKKDKELIKDLESPFKLREKLGEEGRIKIIDRKEIYKALSDKSHTKLASVAVYTLNDTTECIPIGGLEGDFNIAKTLQAVRFVLEVAMAEVEDYLHYPVLGEDWDYNRTEIIHISQCAYGKENGQIEPFITSQNHPGKDGIQASALLEMFRTGHV